MRERAPFAQRGARKPPSSSTSSATVASSSSPKRKKKGFAREPLSAEVQAQLLAACADHTDRLLVIVLLDTGLRISEWSGLVPAAVRWQRATVLVKGKGEVVREVPLTERARKILEIQFAVSQTMPLRPRAAEYRVKKVAERAGIKQPVMPHVLRHSFACNALQAGVDLRALQRAMGHSRISITETYLNYSDEMTLKSFRQHGW